MSQSVSPKELTYCPFCSEDSLVRLHGRDEAFVKCTTCEEVFKVCRQGQPAVRRQRGRPLVDVFSSLGDEVTEALAQNSL